ncbi:MAG: uracil-DNA glycosylase [Actinobacteria bacterium]|nr:MAG: uracil-DNA glycosylase [Actinomycetota bacterium]
MSALTDLEQKAKECSKCTNLCKDRTNVVFGDGNDRADLMFVGEAPGRNEDLQGKPFVGAAGQLLSKLLASIGLKREDVYIANVLKCRPPNNRDPLPDEIAVCKPLLFEQIKIIKPKIVATLGAHATRLLLDKPISISKIHGQKFKADSYTIFPIYHPAAALYARTTLVDLEEDFRKLKKILNEKPDPEPEKVPQAKQQSLF